MAKFEAARKAVVVAAGLLALLLAQVQPWVDGDARKILDIVLAAAVWVASYGVENHYSVADLRRKLADAQARAER